MAAPVAAISTMIKKKFFSRVLFIICSFRLEFRFKHFFVLCFNFTSMLTKCNSKKCKRRHRDFYITFTLNLWTSGILYLYISSLACILRCHKMFSDNKWVVIVQPPRHKNTKILRWFKITYKKEKRHLIFSGIFSFFSCIDLKYLFFVTWCLSGLTVSMRF